MSSETTETADVRARLVDQLVVRPGEPARITARDPGWTGGPDFEHFTGGELKQRAKEALARGTAELSDAQELLWASDRYALLVVLQAMYAAGKDSAIEHVVSGVNPQGVQVVSFKQPSSEELDHDFLWRASRALPERGRIGIFNRSHYEEVVALKVHPEWLEAQRLPPGDRDERRQWLVCIGLAFIVIPMSEVRKAILRRREPGAVAEAAGDVAAAPEPVA